MPPKITKTREVYLSLKKIAMSLNPNDPLPGTIRHFAQKYSVNHKTVEAAVARLKRNGFITAQPRLGLRVSPFRPSADEDAPSLLYVYGGWRDPDGAHKIMADAAGLVAERAGIRMHHVKASRFESMLPMAAEGSIPCAIISYFSPYPGLDVVLEKFSALGVRICTIDEQRRGFDAVVLDNRRIGRQLGRLLFTPASHRRVLLCQRYLFAQPEYERDEGLREVMMEMKVPHSRVVWFSHYNHRDAPTLREALARLFNGGVVVDAVFMQTAWGVEQLREACGDAGVPVPFVVAVDTEETLKRTGISGVAVSVKEMGVRAAEMVLDRLRNPSAKPRIVSLEGRIYMP